MAIVGYLVWNRSGASSNPSADAPNTVPEPLGSSSDVSPTRASSRPGSTRIGGGASSDEETHRWSAEIRDRVGKFAKGRREVAHAYAKHLGIPVLQDVDQFFLHLESGNWEEAARRAGALEKLMRSEQSQPPPGLIELWPAIFETRGVMETAKAWPPQALMEFGRTLDENLGPGTVLLAGGDATRFVPTLLGDSPEGSSRVVLTQSSFADSSYLNYARFQYGDRVQLPEPGEVEQAFQAALKKHGQLDGQGKMTMSGPEAVTSINETLVSLLVAKNPEMKFALQETHAMPATHAGAELAGALTMLGQGQGAEGKSPRVGPEEAARTVIYWQDTVERLRSDPAVSGSVAAREGWAELAMGQANLLNTAERRVEAETLYRAAANLVPESAAATTKLAQWLAANGRAGDAIQALHAFSSAYPDQAGAVAALMEAIRSGKAGPR